MKIGAEIRIPAGELPPEIEKMVRAELSIPNPAFVKAHRAGRYTGNLPRTLEGWRQGTGFGGPELVLPRGYALRLLDLVGLAEDGQTPLIDPKAVRFTLGEGEPLPPTELRSTLRDYQVAAVNAAADGPDQGLLVLPCGAGKTVVGLALARRAGRSTLVLVHTEDLLRQWVERTRDVLGLEAGTIGLGKKDRIEPVTIGMVQTLARRPRGDLAELGRRFGTLLVDEAHHGPARTYVELLRGLNCRRRVGLTATPKRDDGLSAMLAWGFGGILYQVEHAELLRRGFLIAPTCYTLPTSFETTRDAAANFVGTVSDLVEDPGRNALLVAAARWALERGTVLLLLSRVEHCEVVAGLLREEGIAAEALTGEVKRADRADALEGLRSGRVRVAVATQLADEGLDVPTLGAVILGAPGRAESRTIQRIGRVMRPAKGKGGAVVVDLVDELVPLLLAQSKVRARSFGKVLGEVDARRLRQVGGHNGERLRVEEAEKVLPGAAVKRRPGGWTNRETTTREAYHAAGARTRA